MSLYTVVGTSLYFDKDKFSIHPQKCDGWVSHDEDVLSVKFSVLKLKTVRLKHWTAFDNVTLIWISSHLTNMVDGNLFWMYCLYSLKSSLLLSLKLEIVYMVGRGADVVSPLSFYPERLWFQIISLAMQPVSWDFMSKILRVHPANLQSEAFSAHRSILQQML